MESVKLKRVCKAPYKKWSEKEFNKLITFLKENRPIEKPTAREYYTRFMEENGVDSEWANVRCKVKNMRDAYRSAKTMLNSSGAGAMVEDESMERVILKRCPKFKEYEDIFSHREGTIRARNFDADSNGMLEACAQVTCSATESQSSKQSESMFEFHDFPPESLIAPKPEVFLEDSRSLSPLAAPKVGQEGIYLRTSLSELLHVQSDILSMRKIHKETEWKLKETELEFLKHKFSFEREMLTSELNLQKERFSFEKEKHEAEVKHLEKKLETNREMRIMEMNITKEIALEKIKSKERIEMERLKKVKT